MPDRVVIPLAGIGTLVLDEETYRAGLQEGSKLGPPVSDCAVNELLLDAEQLASVLSIPVTWIEQKAREGAIPSLEFGRWRRFRRSDVEAAVRRRNGQQQQDGVVGDRCGPAADRDRHSAHHSRQSRDPRS